MPKTQRLGGRVRALRRREQLTQKKMAEQLGISPSYLNLIEHDRRPLSAELLIKLAQEFHVDLADFADGAESGLVAELMEAFGDPLFESFEVDATDVGELAAVAPNAAQAVAHLYQAYRTVRDSARTLAARLSEDLALPGFDRAGLPSEQVSDFIQRNWNYFPDLEDAAEALWHEADLERGDLLHGMSRYLTDVHGVQIRIVKSADDGGAVRRYDESAKRLVLSESLPLSSRTFQIAYQIALLSHGDLLTRVTDRGELTTPASRELCRIAMANYYAGAVLMPYESFLDTATAERYDVELIGNHFAANFEQVCHRLTSLRRPGAEGIPFHFVRGDIAGNISKRFSGSGIQISRFGGSCPRWNLHTAFLTPGRITTQLSRTSDGQVYFCIARTVARQARGYHAPTSVQAITVGCRLEHASALVYTDGMDLENLEAAVPIGTTCRLCEQLDCEQRVFPPIQHPLEIDETVRGISFYAPVRTAK